MAVREVDHASGKCMHGSGTCWVGSRQGSVVVLQDWFHLLQQHSQRALCSLLPPCYYPGNQPFNGLLLPATTRVVTRVVTAQGS
jgi:hypothetical protein